MKWEALLQAPVLPNARVPFYGTTHSWSISMYLVALKISWLNHQATRLMTMLEKISSFDKKLTLQDKKFGGEYNWLTRCNLARKFCFVLLIVLKTENKMCLNKCTFGFAVKNFIIQQLHHFLFTSWATKRFKFASTVPNWQNIISLKQNGNNWNTWP